MSEFEKIEPGVAIGRAVSAMMLKYPITSETTASMMGGLAGCLVTLAVAHFGKEGAAQEVSHAINAALVKVNEMNDELEKGGL